MRIQTFAAALAAHFLLGLPISLPAQLYLRHHIDEINGKVLKKEKLMFTNVALDDKGEPVELKTAQQRSVFEYRDGNLLKHTFYSRLFSETEQLEGYIEYDWENGLLSEIREYVVDHAQTVPKTELHARFKHYWNDKRELIKEEVYDKKGALMLSFEFERPALYDNLPLYVFQEFRHRVEGAEKGYRYGIQYDALGDKKLHFMVNNQDTVFFLDVRKLSDTRFRGRVYKGSSEKREENIFIMRHETDEKGNDIRIFRALEGTNEYAVTLIRYQYEGDPDWPEKTEFDLTQLPGFWQNEPHNILLEWNNDMGFLLIFPSKIKENLPVEVSRPDLAWIYHLSNQSRGQCIWIDSTQVLRINFPDKTVLDCQLTQKGAQIELVPVGPNPKPLLLSKTKAPEKKTIKPPSTEWKQEIKVREVEPPPSDREVVIEAEVKNANGRFEAQKFESRGQYGLRNANRPTQILIPAEYDAIDLHFMHIETWALVKKGNKTGLFQTGGKPLLPIEYEQIVGSMFLNDRLLVKKDGFWAYTDTLGQARGGFRAGQYEELAFFEYPMTLENETPIMPLKAKKQGKWGAIDPETGKILVDFQYDFVGASSGKRHFRVKKSQLLGVVDQNGGVEVPIEYHQILESEYGVYKVMNAEGLWGIRTGKGIIVPVRYQRQALEKQVTPNCILAKERDSLFTVYSKTGAFDPFQCRSFERVYERDMAVNLFHLTNGQIAIVHAPGRNNEAPTLPLQIFDRYEIHQKSGEGFMVVIRQMPDRSLRYGLVAQVDFCVAQANLIEIDYNITLDDIDAFTRKIGSGRKIIAAGRDRKDGPRMIFSASGEALK